jgi:hypothetical protein
VVLPITACEAATPPIIGYIVIILSHNPLDTNEVNKVVVAADIVGVIPVPPAVITALR